MKAFDRVNYCKLFRLLIRRNLPPLLVRVMLNFYISNFVRVSWCGYFSEYFLATNCVKQGKVLSPVLFCVYLNELLLALSAANVGCYVGDYFVCALAYADDLVLTAKAPSATARQKMLAICDTYASEYSMNFNANKSKCMVDPPSCRHLVPLLSKCVLNIGSTSMEIVTSYCHLGHTVNSSLSDEQDILSRHRVWYGIIEFNVPLDRVFIGQVNSVLCYFGKLPSVVKAQLFCSYCTSFLWLYFRGFVM